MKKLNQSSYTLSMLLVSIMLLVLPMSVLGIENPSFFKGFTAMNEGRYDDASMYLRISIKSNPEYLPAYSHLGLVYERKKEFEKAKEVWQEYTKFDSYFKDEVKRHIEMIDTYVEAEKFLISAPTIEQEQTHLNQANGQSSTPDLVKVTTLLEEVIASDKYPMSVIWLYAARRLGGVYFNSDNYVHVIPLYEKIDLYYPKDITEEILYQYAYSYQKEEEFEKAIEIYKKLDRLFQIKDRDKIEKYKNLVALCYEGIGDEYLIKDEYKKAKETYETILGKFPTTQNIEKVTEKKLKAEENLAYLYKTEADNNVRVKEYSEACEYYQRIIDECAQSSYYKYAQEGLSRLTKLEKGMLDNAMGAYQKEKYPEAIELYQKFIEYFPKSTRIGWVKFRIGMSYAANKQFRESVSKLMKLAQEYPQSPWADIALERAGLYCWQMLGNEKQAEKIFKYIVTKYPKGRATDNVLYYLGVIYMGRENYKLAYYSFKGLIDHFPDSNLTQRAKIGIMYIGEELKNKKDLKSEK